MNTPQNAQPMIERREVVLRTFSRTVHDDFVLNVQTRLSEYTEAVPLYSDNQELVGWKIQNQYD